MQVALEAVNKDRGGSCLVDLSEPDAQAHGVLVPPAMFAVMHVLASDTSSEVGGLHKAMIATIYDCLRHVRDMERVIKVLHLSGVTGQMQVPSGHFLAEIKGDDQSP